MQKKFKLAFKIRKKKYLRKILDNKLHNTQVSLEKHSTIDLQLKNCIKLCKKKITARILIVSGL